MKKKIIVFVSVLSLLLGQATAQIPIPFLDSSFFYPRVCFFDDIELFNWQWDRIPPTGYLPYNYEGDSDIMNRFPWIGFGDGVLFIEEYGSRIYGIATCADTNQLPATIGVGVYDKNLQLLGSVNGDEPHYSKNTMYTLVTNPGRHERPVPYQLHLFNEPVVLPDTFYVGFFSTIGVDSTAFHGFSVYFLQTLQYPVIILNSGLVTWEPSHVDWGMLLPIRELPCPVGPEPNLVASLSGQTVLGWQAGDTTLYLLDFFDEDGHLLFESDTLSQTGYVLTDSLLDAAGYHESGYLDVRLRRACSYMASSYHTVVWSPWSASRRFYHQRGVEGLESVALPELTVSPNPATGMLHVEGEAGALQLLDLQGREVHIKAVRQSGNQPTIIDVSALPRGVYLLRLTTAQGTASRRVVLM